MKTIAQQLGITEFPFIVKDSNYNILYYEDSDGYWYKREYDSNGNEIYFENSNGIIRNNRPKVVEMTMEEICKVLGKNVKIIK